MSRISTSCVFKIVFSSPGQVTSCGSASLTALISSLNSMFTYIEVRSYAIRVQSEEIWCDSISHVKYGLSHFCVLFLDDGEKEDTNDLSNVVCWASNLCNDWVSRERLLSECVSAW